MQFDVTVWVQGGNGGQANQFSVHGVQSADLQTLLGSIQQSLSAWPAWLPPCIGIQVMPSAQPEHGSGPQPMLTPTGTSTAPTKNVPISTGGKK
jgi:hypothetical protein